MRKWVCIAAAGIVFFSTAYSQEAKVDEGDVSKVVFLIEDGLFNNVQEIQQESLQLNPFHKMMLYEDYKKSAGVPFACNLLLNWGIGSFVQKDWFGGVVGLGGNLLGFSMWISGANMTETETYYSGGARYSREILSDEGMNRMTTGLLVIMGSYVFQLIRPFVFANDYNKTLRRALSSYAVSYNIEPEYVDGDSKIKASVKVQLQE